MNEAAKKRMIGVVALVLLMVIFVPMLFDDDAPRTGSAPLAVNEPTEVSGSQSEPPAEVFLPSGSASEELALDEEELVPLDQLSEDTDWGSQTTESPDREAASERQVETPKMADEQAPEPRSEPEVAAPDTAPVSARAQPQPALAAGSYVVQVAALSTPERADRLVQELEGNGFAPFIERAEVGGKVYYRVRLGPRGDRAAAEQLAAALRQATAHRGQVLVVQ